MLGHTGDALLLKTCKMTLWYSMGLLRNIDNKTDSTTELEATQYMAQMHLCIIVFLWLLVLQSLAVSLFFISSVSFFRFLVSSPLPCYTPLCLHKRFCPVLFNIDYRFAQCSFNSSFLRSLSLLSSLAYCIRTHARQKNNPLCMMEQIAFMVFFRMKIVTGFLFQGLIANSKKLFGQWTSIVFDFILRCLDSNSNRCSLDKYLKISHTRWNR